MQDEYKAGMLEGIDCCLTIITKAIDAYNNQKYAENKDKIISEMLSEMKQWKNVFENGGKSKWVGTM